MRSIISVSLVLLLGSLLIATLSQSANQATILRTLPVDVKQVGQETYYSGDFLRRHAKTEGLKLYFDQISLRGLLERDDQHRALFLANSRFLTYQGNFMRARHPILAEDGRMYIPRSLLQSELKGLISEARFASLPVSQRKKRGACAKSNQIKRVMLDPGHGGADFGARRDKVREKQIVLDFAKRAAEELKRKGFEVQLTRSRDVFIPLDIRPALALAWNADIFISIHANSFQTKNAMGTETYILNRQATNEAARKVAIAENQSAFGGANKKSGGDALKKQAAKKQGPVQDILWDMQQNAYLQDSAHLASRVHNAVLSGVNQLLKQEKKGFQWRNRGVLQAPFLVLSQSSMPAILLELGFLSNSRDRELLTSERVQTEMAKAVANGVKSFANYCSR